MKNLRKFAMITAMVAVAVGLTTSCDDVSLCDLDESDLGMGDAFLETTSYFMNVVTRVDEAIRDNDLQTNGTATIDGATVTLTMDSLIIDFGSTNVVTNDGRSRRGKVKGSLTGDYFTSGGAVDINMDNYHVDDVLVAGDISVVNNGLVNGEWSYDITSTAFTIGTEYSYNANLNMAWLSGFATQDSTEDDVFTIGGNNSSASGSDLLDGVTFTCNFVQAMKFDRSCQYVVTEGIVDVIIDQTSSTDTTQVDVSVDFLSSDLCNNVVMLSASCDETSVSFPQNFDGF